MVKRIRLILFLIFVLNINSTIFKSSVKLMIDLRLATAHEPSHPSVFNGCPHFNFKPTTYEEAVSRSSSRSS